MSTKTSIRIASESDEYQTTIVEAVPPTWRDTWRILRGTYKPQVVKRTRPTTKGMARMLKQTWTSEAMRKMMHSQGLLSNLLEGHDTDTPAERDGAL